MTDYWTEREATPVLDMHVVRHGTVVHTDLCKAVSQVNEVTKEWAISRVSPSIGGRSQSRLAISCSCTHRATLTLSCAAEQRPLQLSRWSPR